MQRTHRRPKPSPICKKGKYVVMRPSTRCRRQKFEAFERRYGCAVGTGTRFVVFSTNDIVKAVKIATKLNGALRDSTDFTVDRTPGAVSLTTTAEDRKELHPKWLELQR